MLESEVHQLLFRDRYYFHFKENCDKYSKQELFEILNHLRKLEEKYFRRILELHNDRHERDEKITGRLVMEMSIKKINEYLEDINKLDHFEMKEPYKNEYTHLFIFILLIVIIYNLLESYFK